jgi:hypothetical protein
MDKKITKRYQLCIERIETIEDIKKIFNTMQIRIDTDNPLYEELKEYFAIEVVPKGYIKLLETIGEEKIAKMNYEEMEQKIIELGL